jgi:trk system potassium uptake protein
MKLLRNPIRLVPSLFLLAIAVGTVLLSLPVATMDGSRAPFLTALFTATSAVAVTGLVVVDTGTYWSPFGQVAILLMFQIGGLGIMTAATLFGIIAGRGFGLHERLTTQVERGRLERGDTLSVLKLVVGVTLAVEAVTAILLTVRMAVTYDMSPGTALWNGVFHSISAFNNAGFSTHADSVMGYQTDPLILIPIMAAIILGSVGFPVMQDLRDKRFDWRR